MGKPTIYSLAHEKGFRVPVHLLQRWCHKIHNAIEMKRKYIASYYEYGLTKRKTRKFFFELSAYLWKAWLEYRYKDYACVEIKEDDNE